MAGKDGSPMLNCKTVAFEPQDFPNMEETSKKVKTAEISQKNGEPVEKQWKHLEKLKIAETPQNSENSRNTTKQ